MCISVLSCINNNVCKIHNWGERVKALNVSMHQNTNIKNHAEPWWLSWLEGQFHGVLSTQGRGFEPGYRRSFLEQQYSRKN